MDERRGWMFTDQISLLSGEGRAGSVSNLCELSNRELTMRRSYPVNVNLLVSRWQIKLNDFIKILIHTKSLFHYDPKDSSLKSLRTSFRYLREVFFVKEFSSLHMRITISSMRDFHGLSL